METTTARRVLADIDKVDRAIAVARDARNGSPRAVRAWQVLGEVLEGLYNKERLRYSTTLPAKFIQTLVKNRDLALGALVYYVHGDEANNPLVAGIARAVLFDQGLDGVEVHRQQLIDLHASWRSQFETLSKEFRAQKEELEAVKRTYTENMALQAPVTYWRSKASKHRSQKLWFGGLFLVAACIFGGLFRWVIVDILDGYRNNPWRITMLVAIAVPAIWILRMLARFLLSNAHLETDANERAVMLETYLSLLKEQNAMKPEDRQLVLHALFTSTQSGLVVDDAAPATPWDLLTKVKT